MTLAQPGAQSVDEIQNDKLSLYDENQRKKREESFLKLRSALNYTRAEKLEQESLSKDSSSSDSSQDSYFDKTPLEIKIEANLRYKEFCAKNMK